MRRLTFVRVILLIALASFGPTRAQAQLIRSYRLDIGAGLAAGTMTVTSTPGVDAGSLEKLFDGNPFTEAGARQDTLLQVTLSLGQPTDVTASKIFPWVNLQYQLEAAASLEDLESRSGSYVLAIENRNATAFNWDSVQVALTGVQVFRLTLRNVQMPGVYLGEWELQSSVTLTSLAILPQPLMLIPNTWLQLRAQLEDEQGRRYPYDLDEPVRWSSSNPEVASVEEMGLIRAHKVGQARIYATTSVLSGSTTVRVIEDFESENDDPIEVKVALVIQDQIIDTVANKRIHEIWHWTDPMRLVNQIIEEFNMVTEGVVRFRIVETHNDQVCFTRLRGQFMRLDTLAYYYGTPSRLYGRNTPGTLQNLAEVQGLVKFDYNAMIDFYQFDTKRNNGQIDEVWVYGPPFAGMYESQLVGPGAFWWNSPPLDHPGLEKILSVMGWNYERGVAEALHSFGHRFESAMAHFFGRWDTHAEDPNEWELFTRIDKDHPGEAHVGNIHFPPNGMSDYDYANRRYVESYADNWKRYPILLSQKRQFNCSEWGCSQLGYMRWWFAHIPHFKGVHDGILNNWWWYALDYYEALRRAEQLTAVGQSAPPPRLKPGMYILGQNYPNPFNAFTTIDYHLARPESVTIRIYDLLGREVRTVLNEWQSAGWHSLKLDVRDLPTGVYFYRITAGTFRDAKRFLLLK